MNYVNRSIRSLLRGLDTCHEFCGTWLHCVESDGDLERWNGGLRRMLIVKAKIGIFSLGCVILVARVASGQDTGPVGDKTFESVVQPFLHRYCLRCHNIDVRKSGIRVDNLTAVIEDRHLALWKEILKQVDDEVMPPEEEPQPSGDERKSLETWITGAMNAALLRNTQKNGLVRRLTVSQYRNTLRDLLGLDEDLTEVLPPDGISKDGFVNNAQTLLLSPLQVENYFDIAERALDLCIVDESSKPLIQNFRMDLGRGINSAPCPDKLILGANSHLLENSDFVVTQLTPAKPFAYEPFFMQTKFDFIEGYVGNDTIRKWRNFDSIYHAVFACMRGSPGYPKGEAFQTVPGGLLLRPAIPSSEIFGVSNTYGPMANFKVSLRELPDHGNFRITVNAARYEDGLLLDAGAPVASSEPGVADESITIPDLAATTEITIATPGIYQADVYRVPGDFKGLLTVELGDRHFAGQLPALKKIPAESGGDMERPAAFLQVRLPAGAVKAKIQCADASTLRRIELTRLADDSELAKRFVAFEKRSPSLGVHLGLRRDCGSTLTRAGEPQVVASGERRDYVFEGPINDFPSPDVEKHNVNYLAGVRDIGIRHEYTDGRDMPRLLIRSVEFEGPYYASWPPATHRQIFLESHQKDDPPAYAREIIRSFATRAFRRPATDEDANSIFAVWKSSFDERQNFRQSIKDALLIVLTSPQFLFLIENSSGPEPEDLDPYELASKLSYFLWNTAPDLELLELAAVNGLDKSLDKQIDRMIHDPRFGPAIHEFASQWLSLDKFDVVSVDTKRFPKMTRDTKARLRLEPVHFVRYLMEQNRPLREMIQSNLIVADETVASYYNLGARTETGFRFVPLEHHNPLLGGVLTQAAILSGLSDGRESNPIKRGAWFARKMIAEPPDDPPPNVPKLPEDDGQNLTLRQKLERHRNQEGCAKCHSGIDPWGIPFESFDAAGLAKKDVIDTRSRLPDGTEINDLNELKRYLTDDRFDKVVFSFLKHMAAYATGRSLTYNELVFLRKECINLRSSECRTADLVKFVVKSDLFMKK